MIPVAAMTEKDRSDLEAALDAGVDWIALSFVQRPEDVAEVKKVARGRALVMSKLEKPQAITRLDEIMEISDAVMVARGDLGVEMPLEKVPGIQKRIVRAAPPPRQAGGRGDPDARIDDHRAGADPRRSLGRRDRRLRRRRRGDAVGRERLRASIPIEAVATMSRIAEEVEQDQSYWSIMRTPSARRRRRPARTRSPPARTRSPTRSAQDHRGLDLLGLDRLPHRPRAAELDRGRPDAERQTRPAAWRWSGACIRSAPRMRATWTTWRSAPASSPCARASRRSATASSSWPACPSARPAPPTWCASPSSARSTPPSLRRGASALEQQLYPHPEEVSKEVQDTGHPSRRPLQGSSG